MKDDARIAAKFERCAGGELDSELDVENSLHKVDVLVDVRAEFRAGLVEEGRLYRKREPEVERLNRSDRQPHRRRLRRSARR